jgi:hypothetical protein
VGFCVDALNQAHPLGDELGENRHVAAVAGALARHRHDAAAALAGTVLQQVVVRRVQKAAQPSGDRPSSAP